MPTISLRNRSGATFALFDVDAPIGPLSVAVAQLAEQADFVTPVDLLAARAVIHKAVDMAVGNAGPWTEGQPEQTESFDTLTIDDDGVMSDFPLGQFDVARDYHGRWTSGPPGGGGKHQDGYLELSHRGPRTPAQADAARSSIGEALAAAGKDWDARAKVLGSIDAAGDAATIAEHDRLAGDQWTQARQVLHDQIIFDRLNAAADVGFDREAILVGGLPGAGKTNVLNSPTLGIDTSRYLHIDPDSIKTELLDRGAVTRVPGMSDGEHAALIHEESTFIADQLHAHATARGMNVIIDKTMSAPPEEELAVLRRAGYSVRGVFVDVPVDESLASADRRWKEGGRFIPPPYIEAARIVNGSSRNLKAFQTVSPQFDDWVVVNNAGISKGTPKGKVRKGSGRYEFAAEGIVVHRETSLGLPDPRVAPAQGTIIVDGGTVHVDPDAIVDLVLNLANRPAASDLTKVHINGYPLFTDVAANQLRRIDMPQIPDGHLDAFKAYLRDRGIKLTETFTDPTNLRATQNELDGRKVGGMVACILDGTMVTDDKPLWVSNDMHLLDGHHRWAAEAVLSAGDEPRSTAIVLVDLPIAMLVPLARQFAALNSIDSKSHGMALWQTGMTVLWRAGFTSEGARKAWLVRHRNGEGAATSSAGLANGLPTASDFVKMEKTGGPLGSQGGGWYRDEHGQKYLVKPAQSATHAHNELAAHILYKHAGVPTDDTGIFQDGDKWFIAKKAIQGPDGKLGKIVGNDVTDATQVQARDGFGADAVASSWDAYGLVGDNVLTQGGTLYRIDVGGSGMYRAMGGDKTSFNPGHEWTEPTSLRTSNQGKKLYGDMTDSEAARQLARLQDFDIPGFDAKLTAAGIDPKVRARYVSTVTDRIQNQLPDILNRLTPRR